MVETDLDLRAANAELAALSAADRIRWASERFGSGLLLTTSFGTYSAVMLHLTKTVAPEAPIVSIDLGHTEGVDGFAQTLKERLDLQVHEYVVPPPAERKREGESDEDSLRREKVETLERALAEHGTKVWMSGVQKGETAEREAFDFLMRREDGLLKLHPVLDWTSKELFEYCKQHNLPMNFGYFDPLKGEDQNKECGIHLTGLKKS